METKGFFQFEIILALSDSFEYICYGSMAIINVFTLAVRGPNLVPDVYRRQMLTSTDVRC